MPKTTPFRSVYRILTWTSLAGLLVTIALVLRKAPPPAVAYDPAAAARVDDKLAAADQAKASGQPAQVQIDRTELNSYLAQNLDLPTPASANAAGNPGSASRENPPGDPAAGLASTDEPTLEQVQSSVKDVKVDMVGDVVKAYVIFDFHGKDLSLELDGHLGTQNGYLKFEPVAGKLGSLPLPQSTLQAAVDKLMTSSENRDKLKLPDDISDIKIEDARAVLSYK
jgi:hypothetical protein